MTVPYIFANQVGTISLAELDANFSAVGASANAAATVTANAQPNITSVGILTSLSVTGAVTAGFFTGNGAGLTGVVAVANVGSATQLTNGSTTFNIPVAGGNVVGNIGGTANVYTFSNIGANIAGYVNATGNIVGGNITSAGTIAGNRITGNGAALTSLTATNIVGTVANATYAVRAGSAVNATQAANAVYATQAGSAGFATSATLATLASTAGTVTSNAQPNITSVGTLSTLSVTGNVTASNFIGTFAGNISNAVYAVSAGTATTVSASSQPAITNVGVLDNLSVNGNVLSGNVYTGMASVLGNITTANYFVGNGAFLSGITANYSNANVAAYLPTYTGNITANNIIATAVIRGSGGIVGSNLTTGGFVTAIGNVYGNNVIANNFVSGGAGTPTLTSATNLVLSAGTGVQVTGGGTLRLPSLTTADIANLVPVNGDIIYNSSLNKFQGYENGAWGNLI